MVSKHSNTLNSIHPWTSSSLEDNPHEKWVLVLLFSAMTDQKFRIEGHHIDKPWIHKMVITTPNPNPKKKRYKEMKKEKETKKLTITISMNDKEMDQLYM